MYKGDYLRIELTDFAFPKFLTIHDRNAVFPIRADTFCGDFTPCRCSKNGSSLPSSPTDISLDSSSLLNFPDTLRTSEKKGRKN